MKKANEKKIVITGGHHTSALIVAEKLREQGIGVHWVGHKYSAWKDKNPSIEYRQVKKAGFPFYDLKAGKRQETGGLVMKLKIPLGFINSLFLILKIRPNLVLSFGGYLSLPFSVCANFLNIPVVTHEQTSVAGSANKIISKFAKKILLSFESSASYFEVKDKKKVVLTGLPLRTQFAQAVKKIKESKSNEIKNILVLGGKQGSHKINLAIEEVIDFLATRYKIVHQTGDYSVYNDFERMKVKKLSLGEYAENYQAFSFLETDDLIEKIQKADLVISRAGAHAVVELAVLKKRALLIPISWLTENEQTKNALWLKNLGLATILEEDKLDGKSLIAQIEKIPCSRVNEGEIAEIQKKHLNAADKVVLEVLDVLK